MQEKEREKRRKGGGVWTGVVRKVKFGRKKEYKLISRAHFPSEEQIENIIEKVKHSNVITATELSEEFDLKVSTVKKILETMREDGLLEYVDFTDSDFKAYTPVNR